MSIFQKSLSKIVLPVDNSFVDHKGTKNVFFESSENVSIPSAPSLGTEEAKNLKYFDTHNIFPHLDSIINKVLNDKPEDPEKYILQEMRKWDAEESGSEYTAALLQEHAHFSFPVANKSALFHPQMHEMEEKLRGELENEKQALEYERIRAFEFVSEVSENEEAKREESTSKEINMLKKLLGLIKMEKVVVHSMNVERTIESGDEGRPLLSTSVLRFIIGFGLAGDVSQLSLNALSFHSKYMKSPSAIPLNHSFRFLCEGPLHFGKLHSLHHPAAGSLLPVQAPSVCYQAVHKLLIEYALFHGKRMACEGLREEDTCRCAKQSGDLDSKGLQVVYQFHLLLRVCHMWLVTYSKPVCAWSQLLHLSLYSLIGYEGSYLTPTLIMDLGKAFQEVLLLELHSAVKGERSLQSSCNLNAQACFSWIVRESVHILSDLKTPHAKMLEDASSSQSQMTVKQLLQSVLSSTVHRPQRLEDLSLYRCVEDESSPQTLSTSSISLNFSSITEAQVKNALLTSRSSLAQFTHISELLDLFRQFEQKSISEVADHLDTLAFGERDDLAVLLSLALQCTEQERSASGLSHVTKIEEINSANADVLFLRSKLVAAFVETIVAAQYESAVALLGTSSLGRNFSAPSIPSVMAKCMVRQQHRPTLLEVLLSKFKFTTVESLSTFFGILGKIMEGKDGVAHSVFESSGNGMIFVYYPELTQVMARYIKEMESTAVVILFARWNRLIRYSVFSAISYAVRSQTEVIVANILERKKNEEKRNSTNKILFRVDLTNKSEEMSVMERTTSILTSKIDQEENSSLAVDPTLLDVTDRLTSLEEHQISEKLFFEVQKRLHNNSDSGMFLDSIQNPITRERLSEKEGGLTVHEWDFVKLAQQIHHPGFWFHELLSKTNIMVQYDISTHELTRIATVSLQHSKDVVVAVEKAHQHEAEECKTTRASTALSLPSEKTSKSAPSNLKRKGIDHQAIFDTVLCSFAGSSHIFGTLLYQMHSSRCPSFIFSETSSRWIALRDDQIEHIISNSLPVGVCFSSSLYEEARSRLPFCLTRLFSGEISLDDNLELILVLFRCGIMPCRFFDFFTSLQKLTFAVLRTPDAPPYFTYLTHRVLSSYLFHLDRHLDNYTRGREPMMEAWEQYLFQPSCVFEASRAMLDLIPREIMLKSDITMLREKMRLAPQKYVQMFSSQATEKDIMSVAVWFRLHSGIPSSFLEACGVTLFDVFLANYDQSFSVEEEVQQILRIDRAYRVILASTQPKMEDLERLQKLVVDAVAPSHKFPRRQTYLEEDRRIVSLGKGESIHEPNSHGNSIGSRSSFVEVISFHGEGDLAESSVAKSISLSGYHTEDTPRQVMKFFDNLMMNDIALDENAWRCHPLSVHLVYAITHSCIFGGSYYAEATRRFLVDLCFLLYYVKVDSYVSYFFQFFIRLLIIGHPPKLLQDITEALFDILDALEIPFDRRMPVLLVTILHIHLERGYDEMEQSQLILRVVSKEDVRDSFVRSVDALSLKVPFTRLVVYDSFFFNLIGKVDSPEYSGFCYSTSFFPSGSTSCFNNSGVIAKLCSRISNEMTTVLNAALAFCFSFFNRLVITILENCNMQDSIRDKVEKLFEEDTSLRAMGILILLSCGTSGVGLELVSLYGKYIQEHRLCQSAIGPGPVIVWSRTIGILSTIIVDCMADIFSFSVDYKKVLELLPCNYSEVKNASVSQGMERLMMVLSGTVFINSMYLSGNIRTYFSELSTIIYSFLLDYKSDNCQTAKLCCSLKAKLEGTTDDIVVGMCCLLPALGKLLANDMELMEDVTALKEEPFRGRKPLFRHFPPLLKIFFSCLQQLIGVFDNYMRDFLETVLADRLKTSLMLKNALAADHFPICYEDGTPISLRVLLPEPVAEIKDLLIRSLIDCVESICVMRADAVNLIKKKSMSSRAVTELERRAAENTNEENIFLHEYSSQVTEGIGHISASSPLRVSESGSILRKGGVMSFFLYQDMILTESLMTALCCSGLTSADVMRFSKMIEIDKSSTMTSNMMGSGVYQKNSSYFGSTLLNHKASSSEDEFSEEGSLSNMWRIALCLSSQNIRRVVLQCNHSLCKDTNLKTIKALFHIRPLIYVNLQKRAKSQTEYVEWMGQAISSLPYLEDWLLPVLFRTFCLVNDKIVINATKRIRKEMAETVNRQFFSRKNTEDSLTSFDFTESFFSSEANDCDEDGKPIDITDEKQKKFIYSLPGYAHLKNATRSVLAQKLPLKILQDILLDMTHPKLLETLMVVLHTVEKNCEDGSKLKWNLSRTLFYEVSQQRVVAMTRRFCLSSEECEELSDIWKRFRAHEKAPVVSDDFQPPTTSLPHSSRPPLTLAAELSTIFGESLEVTEALVAFLDRLFITHLKSIFRWNTPTASLLAMFVYTDSFEFHKSLYFLRARWCSVAITICNVLQAWGGIESEDQLVLIVRVLRGIRLMRSAVERMSDQKNILSFLQSFPYQKMITICQTEDIQTLALSTAPSTVNRTVVEKSLHLLVTSMCDLLFSLRTVHERLRDSRGNPGVAIRPTDLLHLFVDWSNINSSQAKEVARASFRGLALLISTSLNSLTEKQATAIFENVYPIPPPVESPFTQRGGLGNAILAEQFRLFFTFSLVCCNGLRGIVKDEKYTSTSFLPDFAVKEIRVTLPESSEDGCEEMRKRASQVYYPRSEKSSSSTSHASNFSRPFAKTCIVATIEKIVALKYVNFSEIRFSRFIEAAFREQLLNILTVVLNFVNEGLKGEYSSLTVLFKEHLPRIKECILPGGIVFGEMCLFCFFLLQGIRDRGRLHLSPSVINCCDLLVVTFCRSIHCFFYDSCGESNTYIGFLEQVYRGYISLPQLSVGNSVTYLGRSGVSSYAIFQAYSSDENSEGMFYQMQHKISSGKDIGALQKITFGWKKLIRSQFSTQFPYAEFKIFCFLWILLLSELISIMKEAIPVYLAQFKELMGEESSEQELFSFSVFLHHLSFDFVAKQWITRDCLDASVKEWIEEFEQTFCPNASKESVTKRVSSVASCTMHSLSKTLAQRAFRYEIGSLHTSSFSSDCNNNSISLNREAKRNTCENSGVFTSLENRYTNLFQRLFRPSWTTALLYIVGRIGEVRKADLEKKEVLSAPRTGNDIRIDETVVLSSLFSSNLNDPQQKEYIGAARGGTFASFSNFLESNSHLESGSPIIEKSLIKKKDSWVKHEKFHRSPFQINAENGERKPRENSVFWEISDAEDELLEEQVENRMGIPLKINQVIDGYITLKDLAAAHTPECSWTAINGIVYDITKFVMVHPGGSHVLITTCAGQDCTDPFVKKHLGNKNVLKQLEKMRIGELRE